jgi:hypothetical protein
VSQFDPLHTLQLNFLKAHFDILLSSTLWSAKCSLVFLCSDRKCCRSTPLPSFPCVLHAAPIADSLMGHPTSRNHYCDNIIRVRCSLCQSVPTVGNKKFNWTQHGFRLGDRNRFSVRNVLFCPTYLAVMLSRLSFNNYWSVRIKRPQRLVMTHRPIPSDNERARLASWHTGKTRTTRHVLPVSATTIQLS